MEFRILRNPQALSSRISITVEINLLQLIVDFSTAPPAPGTLSNCQSVSLAPIKNITIGAVKPSMIDI